MSNFTFEMPSIHDARVRPLLACWLASVICCCSQASELRIWVDVNGAFSVEAILESFDKKNVVLKRKDGVAVTIAIDQLSNQDKQYLADHQQRVNAADNPLRASPPEIPVYAPLPLLKLASDKQHKNDPVPIELGTGTAIEISASEPGKLTADPSPETIAIRDALIRIYEVDIHDNCSTPIAVTTISESGTRFTSIAMSIGRGSGSSIVRAKNQLVRFDTEDQKAYVSLNHPDSIRLYDHHTDSNQSLVLTGFSSRGHGGYIGIASGWGPSGITLSQLRSIGRPSSDVRTPQPSLRWAKWVDDEHFVAVIDESLGLWNIYSGRRLYQIDGIDHRATPALSGGRRYLAIPIKGGVVIYETETGKSLGRIAVDRQIPGVRFSPQSDRLAIACSRRMLCWNLTTAETAGDVYSRTILGTKAPVWVDSDLILSSSGVLLSLFRAIPVWRYDISTAEVSTAGNHIVIFRKQSPSELACTTLPHPSAAKAIEWLDASTPKIDPQTWQLLGTSQWSTGAWVDDNLRISTSGAEPSKRWEGEAPAEPSKASAGASHSR